MQIRGISSLIRPPSDHVWSLKRPTRPALVLEGEMLTPVAGLVEYVPSLCGSFVLVDTLHKRMILVPPAWKTWLSGCPNREHDLIINDEVVIVANQSHQTTREIRLE
uniref:Uncharacterized protein n=1 Tax=Branchiostoma floridae TaxID=7739 RepID=C3Z9S6_BRAFL|eukprot:XP_002594761.1 hypothetical protein BRAFLDRAFT_81230 [Branchiostoma floridae]